VRQGIAPHSARRTQDRVSFWARLGSPARLAGPGDDALARDL